MKLTIAVAFVVVATVAAGVLLGQQHTAPSAAAPVYEYKAMSLVEMFAHSETAKKKIAEIMVQDSSGFRRTDMDVPDYTEALNRLAGQGWELVAVNKSNYWVFRRPKSEVK